MKSYYLQKLKDLFNHVTKRKNLNSLCKRGLYCFSSTFKYQVLFHSLIGLKILYHIMIEFKISTYSNVLCISFCNGLIIIAIRGIHFCGTTQLLPIFFFSSLQNTPWLKADIICVVKGRQDLRFTPPSWPRPSSCWI